MRFKKTIRKLVKKSIGFDFVLSFEGAFDRYRKMIEGEEKMRKEEIINELMRLVERDGLIATLRGVFGKRIWVRVPFSQGACDSSIDVIGFSPRADNSLKRAGIFTIGEVIDLIADNGLLRIRNLGQKTQNEIQTRILVFGYERLNEAERKRFFYDVLERACRSTREKA